MCVILNLFWRNHRLSWWRLQLGAHPVRAGLEWGDVGGAQNSTQNSCSGQP